ncbi:hypothetical protein AGR5A_Cc190169 [Agrobacterium genomosp. 5 str. CFBP 6626]|nr:hypothetical protein AGR5A_Cc190169 [Agrobacterium genomosp. 5 str. CFBP 6626]
MERLTCRFFSIATQTFQPEKALGRGQGGYWRSGTRANLAHVRIWLRWHATTDTDTRSKLLSSQVSAALPRAHRTSVRSPKEPQVCPECIDQKGKAATLRSVTAS